MERQKLWAIAAPMVALLVIGGTVGGGVYAWTQLHAPARAPDFQLTTTGFEAGREVPPVNVTLDDYRGKTLLLDFMGVSCAACRVVEKEILWPIHAKYANSTDVAFLSIDAWAGFAGESHEELVTFQRTEGLPWQYALDTDQVLPRYGGFGIPKIVVVDPVGKIVLDVDGAATFDQVDKGLREAIAGVAGPAQVLQVGIVTLAFVAGAASFLAPCCIGMLPAYFGFLLSSVGDGQPKARSLVRGTLLMATGVLAVYAVLAILIAAAGAWLRPWIPYLAPTLALLLIVSAIGMLAGFDWTRLALFRRRGNPAGFFGFGLAYGLAAFGCTGPAFLPIMGSAFLQGATRGGAAFAAFASAIVLFLAGTAALVAAGNQAIWKRFMTHAKAIQRVSAVLMLMGGAYVLWFYARTLS